MKSNYDVIIAGAGIIGLSIARSLLSLESKLKVLIVEKESALGAHASGRNSGVLHAGFYYSPDSLKARFCRDGNSELRKLAENHAIPVRDVGKVVVARNEEELVRLEALFKRGQENGVQLDFLGAEDLVKFEPLAKTHGAFLWSPTTGVSDPSKIINALANEVLAMGGEIRFGAALEVGESQKLSIDSEVLTAKHFVNASGSQSDRIAHKFNLGRDYSMIPFMGVYRAVPADQLPLRSLVYPVPHPLNPFLGVHFTLTSDNQVKIGPTAIPILGREQYGITKGWALQDTQSTLTGLISMFRHGAHDLPALIRSEWPKVLERTLVSESSQLVPLVTEIRGWHRKPPGIRSQLIHMPSGKLEQDFIIDEDLKSTHILNAVSPGWTSALPLGKYVSERILDRIQFS
jgi:L-2-hydroxyglutarate oxidase LhgO